MERILVSMDCGSGEWEALWRAVSLCGRIEARVYALPVTPPPARGAGAAEQGAPCGAVLERLKNRVREARSRGVRIECFVCEGDYEEEVSRFVERERVTLAIVERPDAKDPVCERKPGRIRRILHRLSCRVELVSLRKQHREQRRNQR